MASQILGGVGMGSALGFVTKPTRVIQPGRSPERAIETVTVPPSPRSEGSAIPQNEQTCSPWSELHTLAARKAPLEPLPEKTGPQANHLLTL